MGYSFFKRIKRKYKRLVFSLKFLKFKHKKEINLKKHLTTTLTNLLITKNQKYYIKLKS